MRRPVVCFASKLPQSVPETTKSRRKLYQPPTRREAAPTIKKNMPDEKLQVGLCPRPVRKYSRINYWAEWDIFTPRPKMKLKVLKTSTASQISTLTRLLLSPFQYRRLQVVIHYRKELVKSWFYITLEVQQDFVPFGYNENAYPTTTTGEL